MTYLRGLRCPQREHNDKTMGEERWQEEAEPQDPFGGRNKERRERRLSGGRKRRDRHNAAKSERRKKRARLVSAAGREFGLLVRAPDRSYLQSHHSDRPCLDSDINRLNKYAHLNKSLLFENTLLNQTGTNGALLILLFRHLSGHMALPPPKTKKRSNIHSLSKEREKQRRCLAGLAETAKGTMYPIPIDDWLMHLFSNMRLLFPCIRAS